MAKKNFKNKVSEIMAVVGYYVRYSATLVAVNIARLIFPVVLTVWYAGVFLFSPLWFPIAVIKKTEQTALNFGQKATRDRSYEPAWLDWYVTGLENLVMYYMMRFMWTPFVNILPMKYRREFILNGKKRPCDYPVKTQVAYFKTFCEEGKSNLISGYNLSEEAREAIWKDTVERKYWVRSSRKLSIQQIKDLLDSNAKSLLWEYLKKNTPDRKVLDVIVKYVSYNHAVSCDIMLNLLIQQRPNQDMVERLLCAGSASFVAKLSEVMDAYADLDAVRFSIDDVIIEGEDEDAVLVAKEAVVRQRWFNFCQGKEKISTKAQKLMNHEQYVCFAATGHRLSTEALRYLLIYAEAPKYLTSILNNEYDVITEEMISGMKVVYERYSTYLAVKREREAKTETEK